MEGEAFYDSAAVAVGLPSTSTSAASWKEVSSLADATREHTWHKLRVSKQLEERMTERVGHSLVFSMETKHLYMIGGGNRSGDLKQLWVFPTISSPFYGSVHEKLSTHFPGLYEFACVYKQGDENNEGHETIWVFSGANSLENKNDVYAIDLKDEIVSICFNGKESGGGSDIPVPRTQGNNSCLINLHGEDYLVVFGGGQRGEMAIPDQDLYLFSIQRKTWKKVDTIGLKPCAVQGHAMASIGTKVFLHGGMDQFVFSGNLFVIDLHFEQPIWLKVVPTAPNGPVAAAPCPCPSPRAAHGMVAYKHCLYVCCGVSDEGAITDVWKFDTESVKCQCLQSDETDTVVTVPTPSARIDFAMTLVQLGGGGGAGADDAKAMLLIHGGMNTLGTLFSDFWVFPLRSCN